MALNFPNSPTVGQTFTSGSGRWEWNGTAWIPTNNSFSTISSGLGTTTAPSFSFNGDLDTGMWSPAADTIAFSEGGVEALRITNAGTVTASIDFRAPIFRDSDNTAFLIDPNNTSNLTGLTVANTITGSISGTAANVTGTVAVANGGTGASSLASNGLLLGNGTSAIGATAVGASGQILIGNTGGAPSWANLSSSAVTRLSFGTTGLTPSTFTTGGITVGGTLNVANGGTGVTTSTGTGSVVLNTSPTLVTPTLGAASATSIANGLGAVGTPSYTFTGDLNTGMWSPAADTLAFSTAGSERVRVDASGLVGIGTNSPNAPLTVQSASVMARFRTGSATDGRIEFAYNTTDIGYLNMGSTSLLDLTARSGVALAFGAGGSERMRITAAGDVGIGTSSPSTILHVNAGASFDTNVRLQAAATGNHAKHTYSDAGNTVRWTSGYQSSTGNFGINAGDSFNATGITVTAAGDVGIGTASPVARLHVAGTSFFASDMFTYQNGGIFFSGNGSYNVGVYSRTADLVFQTNSAERARITDAGNLGLGTSSPFADTGFRALDIRGSTGAQINLGTNSGREGEITSTATNGLTLNTINTTPIRFFTNGTEKMRLTNAGDVGVGTTSPGARLEVAGGDARIHGLTVGRGGSGVLSNTAMGTQALLANTTGAANVAMGFSALVNNTTGNNQTALGHQTLFSNTTGGQNTAVGQNALVLNTTGNSNTATGFQALLNNTTGSNNIAAGADALFANTTGNNNTAIGVGAGSALTTGSNNTIIGRVAGTAGLDSTVIIAAGVTERMRIDSGGNLGLGTSAPTVQFQINGTQPQIQWSNPTTGATSNDGTHLYLSGSDFWLVNKETAAMVFATDNTERMRIDASGNLGIGTTSYVGRLSVSLGNATSFGAPGSWDSTYALFGGTTGNAPAVAIGFNSTSGGIISSLAPNVAWRPMNYLGDSHLFMLYGSEAMRLNTAGNLGIGTSSPATRLHVASTGNTTVRIDSTNGQTPELSLFSNGVYDWRIRGGTSLSFTVDATERMRLDPSGNVGIGATLPGATGIAPFVAIGANNAGIGSASANNIAIVTDNTERMRINSAGNVGIGTSSPGTRLDVAGTITATGWSGGGIVTETATQTLTNKRIDPRAVPGGTSGTLTINGNTTDLYEAENLVGAITFAQPSGTPVDGQKLMIRIKDNGTARGITWTTSAGAFRAVGITLPTTTTANRVTYLGCVYNSTDGFWDVLAAATQA